MTDTVFRFAGYVLASLIFASAAVAGEPEPQVDPEKLALGKQVFLETAEPACALCHVLADAGSEGEIGPVLDTMSPTSQSVINAVTNGVGIMPAFEEQLSKEQIEAVALYVSTVAGMPK